MNRRLIGMLTPSSNTVLEPYTSAILQPLLPEVSAHFQRFTVTEISMSDSSLTQFDPEPLLAAARLRRAYERDSLERRLGELAWLRYRSASLRRH